MDGRTDRQNDRQAEGQSEWGMHREKKKNIARSNCTMMGIEWLWGVSSPCAGLQYRLRQFRRAAAFDVLCRLPWRSFSPALTNRTTSQTQELYNLHFALLGGVWTQRGASGSSGAEDEAFSWINCKWKNNSCNMDRILRDEGISFVVFTWCLKALGLSVS